MRVALVGAGGMASHYRSCYANLPGVEWKLAVDLNEDHLAACRELGVERVSGNFEDALADDIDIVDISTPNHMHEPQAVAALNAGKHVLLQKPMANTLESANAIVAAARSANGKLGMYMSSYTNPWVWDIKKIVDAGLLGDIQSFRIRDAHRGGLRAVKTDAYWRSSRDKTGGGCFIQLAIHGINLTCWWLGARITDVFAWSDNQYCPNIGGDDVTVAAVKADIKGKMIPGVIESGYASEGLMREVYGTKGTLRLSRNDRRVLLTLSDAYTGETINYTTPKQEQQFDFKNPSFDDISNPFNQQRMFIEAMQAGADPHMSGEVGRQDLAVVMAVYESAETRQPVKVK